jgi:hypothetical protein
MEDNGIADSGLPRLIGAHRSTRVSLTSISYLCSYLRQMSQFHPLVQQLRQVLKNTYPNQFSLLNPPWRYRLTLRTRVSKEQVSRALHLWNALLAALRKRGWPVELNSREGHTEVIVQDVKVPLVLFEKVVRERNEQSDYPKFCYKPTGNLGFQIDSPHLSSITKEWLDSPEQILEERLSEVLQGIAEAAGREGEWQRERDECHRRNLEEERQREVLRRNEQEEQQRRITLEQVADSWRKAQNLCDFINACEHELQPHTAAATEWLAWAREHAKRIDPLKNQWLRRLRST